MLHSDVNIEQRFIDVLTSSKGNSFKELRIKLLIVLDIMTVLRIKPKFIGFRDVSDMKLSIENNQETIVLDSRGFVVLKDDEDNGVLLDATFMLEQGLVVIPFPHKSIFYHAMLIAFEQDGIPFGEVVPGMCNSWTE